MQVRTHQIELQLKPSLYWRILTFSIFFCAMFAVLQMVVVWYQLIMFMAMSICLLFNLRRYDWFTSSKSILGIRCQGERWWLHNNRKIWYEVQFKKVLVLTSLVTIIFFNTKKNKKIVVFLFSDSAASSCLRKLRVMLKLRDLM